MPIYKVFLFTCLAILIPLTVGCGKDKSTTPDNSDITAPAAVTNLAIPAATGSSATLTWTAPGDDDTYGTAAEYDIRYSTSVITGANFSSATQATDIPIPSATGTVETFTVTGLIENTTYYFALKTADEVPNWSGLSNVVNTTTIDADSPERVTDLAVSDYTDSSATLTWTAPGDDGADGTAAEYDIRYSTTGIIDANFSSASQAVDLPVPGAAGTVETFTVTGLTENTTYYFALKTADEVPNWSGLSNVPSAIIPPRFLVKWGSSGSGDGQFYDPFGIAVDGSGNVYVVDGNNFRIQKFDGTGEFLTQWGSWGAGDGQFYEPRGIAVDGSDNVYVVDFAGHHVQKFDAGGTFLTKWGSGGSGDGQFNEPFDIAVDGSGHVFVLDRYNYRIQKFDAMGTFLTKWGSIGDGNGQFYDPVGIAVDAIGNVYVLDCYWDNIQKFSGTGVFLTKWGSHGMDDGQFYDPVRLTIDGGGNVYVSDLYTNRIQKFDGAGAFLTRWGTSGSGDGQFTDPFDIAVDAGGNIYVTDWGNNRVQKFK